MTDDSSLKNVTTFHLLPYQCRDHRDTRFKTPEWQSDLKQRVVKMLFLENRFKRTNETVDWDGRETDEIMALFHETEQEEAISTVATSEKNSAAAAAAATTPGETEDTGYDDLDAEIQSIREEMARDYGVFDSKMRMFGLIL